MTLTQLKKYRGVRIFRSRDWRKRFAVAWPEEIGGITWHKSLKAAKAAIWRKVQIKEFAESADEPLRCVTFKSGA